MPVIVRFRRSVDREQALDADMFIKVGPLDGITVTKKAPVSSFRFRCASKTRIPIDGNRQASSIGEIDDQIFAVNVHVTRHTGSASSTKIFMPRLLQKIAMLAHLSLDLVQLIWAESVIILDFNIL